MELLLSHGYLHVLLLQLLPERLCLQDWSQINISTSWWSDNKVDAKTKYLWALTLSVSLWESQRIQSCYSKVRHPTSRPCWVLYLNLDWIQSQLIWCLPDLWANSIHSISKTCFQNPLDCSWYRKYFDQTVSIYSSRYQHVNELSSISLETLLPKLPSQSWGILRGHLLDKRTACGAWLSNRK